jgi:hypothetical protein
MKRLLIILVALQSLVGCSAVGRVAIKATPSMRDPSRFEYSIEFHKPEELRCAND